MRLDSYLVKYSFAESRTRAARLIDEGFVMLDGKTARKASLEIDENDPPTVTVSLEERYVGRGGLKLETALDSFEIDVTKKSMLDVGASTGGFTDCLLQRGAAHVTAVDSGRGQLHQKLREDVRVTSIEGFNAREIDKMGSCFDGAVIDVSFISQTLILPALSAVIADEGFLVSLIKPQFEAGRQAIGKKGIVKSEKDRELSVLRVLDCARLHGLSARGVIRSPILGGDGNREFLAYFIRTDEDIPPPAADMLENIKRLCR